MNTKWKKITPKELATKCNNIFNAPLKSENIKYRFLKDLYLTELSFHFNNQEYYARAEKCSDYENTSYTQEYKNSSQQRKVTLNNWGKKDINCYIITHKNTDHTITQKAFWYNPYNRTNYTLSTTHNNKATLDIVPIVESMPNVTPRIISNRLNNIFKWSGYIYLLAFLLLIFVFHDFTLSTFYLLIFGTLFAIHGSTRYSSTKEKNKKLNNLPFKLDFDKEIESHRKIGLKCTKYKNQGEYFKDYNAWESYIQINYKYLSMAQFRTNFLFFLKKEYRISKDLSDTIKTLLFPGIIAIIPLISVNPIASIISLVFGICYSCMEISIYENQKNFIIDFAKVILPNESLE